MRRCPQRRHRRAEHEVAIAGGQYEIPIRCRELRTQRRTGAPTARGPAACEISSWLATAVIGANIIGITDGVVEQYGIGCENLSELISNPARMHRFAPAGL